MNLMFVKLEQIFTKPLKQSDHFRWVNNGGMFIAHNAVRLDEYKRLFTIGRHGKYSTTHFIEVAGASSRNFLQIILHFI